MSERHVLIKYMNSSLYIILKNLKESLIVLRRLDRILVLVLVKEVLKVVWWKNPKRSKFGRWLESQGITQIAFSKHSKISSATMWRLCTDKEYIPSAAVLKKVMKIAKVIDKNKNASDFFDI